MHGHPLPWLRRGDREVWIVESVSIVRCCAGSVFQRAALGGRLAFTAALCLALRLALGRRLTFGIALGVAVGLAFGGHIAGGRFFGFAGRIIAAHRGAVGFTAIGNIPTRAFEDNAHWLKD